LDSWVRTVKDYGESYQKDPRDAEEVPSFWPKMGQFWALTRTRS
jgi:hypothetical protein